MACRGPCLLTARSWIHYLDDLYTSTDSCNKGEIKKKRRLTNEDERERREKLRTKSLQTSFHLRVLGCASPNVEATFHVRRALAFVKVGPIGRRETLMAKVMDVFGTI